MAGTMNLTLSIIEFILALGFLAFLHELGHFLTSRLFNIEVEEFGFGFPPRLKKLFTWGGTEFTLNWIPFGAFVRPKGENDPDIPGGLGSASPWKRLVVMLGGPVMNLITGILLFILVFSLSGAPDPSRVEINGVAADTPAAQVGFQPGDMILKVNGQPISSTDNVSSLVKANAGHEITVTIDRAGQFSDLIVIPRLNPPQGQGALGITLSNPLVPITFIQAFPLSLQITGQYITTLLAMPGRLIQGQLTPDQSRIVGPVGMFGIFNAERSRDLQASGDSTAGPAVNVLSFLAIISVALGFTNLLPLPALDGGRILFLIPELLFHKRIPPRYENMVHAVGMLALIMLLVLITAQDIINPLTLP
jgi:regulator of sigma E protease